MALVLRISSYQHQAMGSDSSRVFGTSGGTIGRAAGNDWVLPDPERYISSKHASIDYVGDKYYLTDTSTNGVYLNDATQPLGQGNKQPIQDGDRLRIGEYEITANIEAETVEPLEEDSLFGHDTTGSQDPFVSEPSPSLLEEPGAPQLDLNESVDPLEALDRQSSGAGASGQSPFPGGEVGAMPDNVPPQQAHIEPPNVFSEQPPATPAAQPPPASGGIPDDWNITGFPEPAPAPIPPSVQPSATPAPAPPIPPDATAETRQTPSPPAQPAQPSGPGDRVALNAFLEHAGLDPSRLPPGSEVALMQNAGQLFRNVVEGLIEVLRARAEIKRQFRVTLTTIRPVENNPLKFSVSADDALENLFYRQGKGFLGPVEAVSEAVDDIKAHQMAVMAGMRAAFEYMVERFDPAELQASFDRGLNRNKLMASLNRTRYWDLYQGFYEEITRDADDNFQRLFGEKFAKAYEEQMNKLTAGRNR